MRSECGYRIPHLPGQEMLHQAVKRLSIINPMAKQPLGFVALAGGLGERGACFDGHDRQWPQRRPAGHCGPDQRAIGP